MAIHLNIHLKSYIPLRLSRRRRRALLLLLLLAVCVAVGAAYYADRLILGENHDTIDPGRAQREVIRVEGRSVEYWVARSPACAGGEPGTFVLFFIGKGGRADQWVEQIAESWSGQPVEVWAMNYPGSGGSEGPVRVKQVGPDALALFDAAEAVAGKRPIFVQGGSFGTTVALCVAARRSVAGVILQNPAPLRQLILGRYGWWNLWLGAGPVAARVPADLDAIANAARCSAPAIFILSGRDRLIPPKYHDRVVQAYAGPKRIIEMARAGHDDALTHEAAESLAEGKMWLWQAVSATKAIQDKP